MPKFEVSAVIEAVSEEAAEKLLSAVDGVSDVSLFEIEEEIPEDDDDD